jgi:hypothetical protein
MQYVGVRETDPVLLPKAESHDIGMGNTEIANLGEQVLCLRRLDVLESVAGETVSRINHKQIIWLEEPSDIVDANSHKPAGLLEIVKGRTATADNYFVGRVNILK